MYYHPALDISNQVAAAAEGRDVYEEVYVGFRRPAEEENRT